MLKQWSSAVVVAAVVCAAAACSSGSGSPSSPSEVASSSPAAPYQTAPTGATIQGTVTAQAGAAAAHAPLHALGSSGVKVSVVGTSLETRSDDSGHFSIGGVPAGTVELHFEAPGVDAHLEIEHVAEGETLEIEVHVSGNQATVGHQPDDNNKPEPEGEVSFKGSIDGLSPLRVAGRTVVTDGSTRLLDHKNNAIAFSALKLGDSVEVEGTSLSDGSVLAKKIKLED